MTFKPSLGVRPGKRNNFWQMPGIPGKAADEAGVGTDRPHIRPPPRPPGPSGLPLCDLPHVPGL